MICTEVLEHLELPDVALKQMLHATRPGGVVFLTTPDGRVDYSGLHINFWSPESWQIFVSRNSGDCDADLGTFKIRDNSPYANNFAIIRRPASADGEPGTAA